MRKCRHFLGSLNTAQLEKVWTVELLEGCVVCTLLALPLLVGVDTHCGLCSPTSMTPVVKCRLQRRDTNDHTITATEGASAAIDTRLIKPAFHDTDTDILADILARIVARMSVSVSWNAGLTTNAFLPMNEMSSAKIRVSDKWHRLEVTQLHGCDLHWWTGDIQHIMLTIRSLW